MNFREKYENKRYKEIVYYMDGKVPSKETADEAFIIAESYRKERRCEESIPWQEYLIAIKPRRRYMETLCKLYRTTDVSVEKWNNLCQFAEEHGEDEVLEVAEYFFKKKSNASTGELIHLLEKIIKMEYDEDLFLEAIPLYLELGDTLSAQKCVQKIQNHTDDIRVTRKAEELLNPMETAKQASEQNSGIQEYNLVEEKTFMGQQNPEKELDFAGEEDDSSESSLGKESDIVSTSDIQEKSTSGKTAFFGKDAGKDSKKEKSSTLINALQRLQSGKKKKRREVPLTIEEYFKDVIGMQEVKQILTGRYAALTMNSEYTRNGMTPGEDRWNFFIGGESGSGKSLLVEIICDMMYQFGLIQTDEPEVIHAKTILNDSSVLDSDDPTPRVILIENIEYLCPGVEVEQEEGAEGCWHYIEKLLERTGSNKKNSCFYIFTGETEAIARQLQRSPKLEIYTTTLKISEYSIQELYEIAKKMISKRGFMLTKEADRRLLEEIRFEKDSSYFANMITLEKIIQKGIENKSVREMSEEDVDKFLKGEDLDFGKGRKEEADKLLKELQSLIGLQKVKEEVEGKIYRLLDRQERIERGEDVEKEDFFLHTILLGPPGTGKTTVARLLGRIYAALGILKDGSLFKEKGRSDLVGQHQGDTAKQTRDIIESAVGGVLFIDEAYELCNGEGDNFGKECISTLVKYALEYRDRMMIIMAGYEKEMSELSRVNPGLDRRFPTKIHFESYTPEELLEIFKLKVKNRYVIHPEAEKSIEQLIRKHYKLKGYENAGGIDVHIDKLNDVISRRNVKHLKGYEEFRDTILKEDIEMLLNDKQQTVRSLEELLEELNGMIGLENVKAVVKDAVNKQKYQKEVRERTGHIIKLNEPHMRFVGPPGTGKSTLAALVTEIYCAIGVVQDASRCITVTAKDFNSSVMGGSREKAKEIFERALGGVLFIDEAYALVADERDTYGKQVIDDLVPFISEHPGEIVVILGGYKDEIEKLLKVNPGLPRRFGTEVVFEPYTIDELVQIFYHMLKKGDVTYQVEEAAKPMIRDCIEYFMKVSRARGEDFGNAGGVSNIVDKVIGRVSSRCMLNMQNLKDEDLFTICKEDFLYLMNKE